MNERAEQGQGFPFTISVVRRESDITAPPGVRARTHSARYLGEKRRGRWFWTPETKALLAKSGGLDVLVQVGELADAALPARYSVAFIGDCKACGNKRQRKGIACPCCRQNGIISEVVLVDAEAADDTPGLRAPGYVPQLDWRAYTGAVRRFEAKSSERKRYVPVPQELRVKGSGYRTLSRQMTKLVDEEIERRGGRPSKNLSEIKRLAAQMTAKASRATKESADGNEAAGQVRK